MITIHVSRHAGQGDTGRDEEYSHLFSVEISGDHGEALSELARAFQAPRYRLSVYRHVTQMEEMSLTEEISRHNEETERRRKSREEYEESRRRQAEKEKREREDREFRDAAKRRAAGRIVWKDVVVGDVVALDWCRTGYGKRDPLFVTIAKVNYASAANVEFVDTEGREWWTEIDAPDQLTRCIKYTRGGFDRTRRYGSGILVSVTHQGGSLLWSIHKDAEGQICRE